MVAMLNWLQAQDSVNLKHWALSLIVPFFFTLSLKPASKGSIRSPCTNRPIICEICNECIWSYNINYHYQNKNNLNDVPIELKITEEEKKFY